MCSKIIKGVLVTTLALGLFTFQVDTADASTKVMWGKTELKVGQIGKVTILENTNLITLNEDGTPSGLSKYLEGEEFRVYSKKNFNGIEFYGVGAGLFIPKWDVVKYETPSKSKLEKLKKNNNEYSNAVKQGKLTKDPNANAEILWTHLGYSKQGLYEHKDGGSAILYSKQQTPTLMVSTDDDLEGRIQINYWNVENTSAVAKETLQFFLGKDEGTRIYNILNDGYKGKNVDKYLDKKLTIGKRQVELSNRPSHLVVYIGKENVKYDEKWNVIK